MQTPYFPGLAIGPSKPYKLPSIECRFGSLRSDSPFWYAGARWDPKFFHPDLPNYNSEGLFLHGFFVLYTGGEKGHNIPNTNNSTLYAHDLG